MILNRRLVMVSAVGAVIWHSVRADAPVIDIVAIGQAIKEVQWLRDQYDEMTQQLRALTNGLDVAGISPGLLSQGMQNPLGGLTGQIPDLVGGATLSGIPGAQQFLQRDRYYQPAGTDFSATTLNGSSTSLANLKGIAMQLMNGNGQRITQLTGLINELTGAQDVSQVSRISGRIAVENQTLAAQAAQVQQLQQMAELQTRVEQQRVLQKIRSDDDQQVEDTQPGNGPNPIIPLPPQAPPFVGG